MAVPAAARQPQTQCIALGGVPFEGEAVPGAGIEDAGTALAQGASIELGTSGRTLFEFKRLKPGVSIQEEAGFVGEVEPVPLVQCEERVCGPEEFLSDRTWILEDVINGEARAAKLECSGEVKGRHR